MSIEHFRSTLPGGKSVFVHEASIVGYDPAPLDALTNRAEKILDTRNSSFKGRSPCFKSSSVQIFVRFFRLDDAVIAVVV